MQISRRSLDAKGVLCLDARDQVRFSLAGTGKLIDNQGTPSGSRVVQVCNGRAEISVTSTSDFIVGASANNISDAFCTVHNA
jgi:beta-galactosidase